MFVRLRWFMIGFLAATVVGAMVIKRARAMKERLDAEGVARIAASYGADAIDALGRALQRSAVPNIGASPNGATDEGSSES